MTQPGPSGSGAAVAFTDAVPDAVPDPVPPAGAGRTPRRAARWALVVAIVLGAAALLTWGGQPPRSSAPYHPANPTYNGAQALAHVLAGQGVDVVVAEGEAALSRATIDADTTVLVTDTGDLREPTIAGLGRLARPAERLVLVRPDRRVVRALAPTVAQRDIARSAELAAGGCSTADVHPDERLTRSQTEYADTRGTGCFVTDGYAVHLTTSGPGLAHVVLVGSTDLVTNERIGQADNAAVILRTLGHSTRLVWYVPDLLDVPPTAAQQDESFTPPWWGSMILLGCFALGAVFLWQGRRFGRLVVEPLPVVVRAIETTESRGRLYRKAHDSARSAAILRAATRRRATAYLGMPLATPPGALAEAVSAVTGRPVAEVGWLLDGPPATTDNDLLGLAATLAALEKEIRRS